MRVVFYLLTISILLPYVYGAGPTNKKIRPPSQIPKKSRFSFPTFKWTKRLRNIFGQGSKDTVVEYEDSENAGSDNKDIENANNPNYVSGNYAVGRDSEPEKNTDDYEVVKDLETEISNIRSRHAPDTYKHKLVEGTSNAELIDANVKESEIHKKFEIPRYNVPPEDISEMDTSTYEEIKDEAVQPGKQLEQIQQPGEVKGVLVSQGESAEVPKVKVEPVYGIVKKNPKSGFTILDLPIEKPESQSEDNPQGVSNVANHIYANEQSIARGQPPPTLPKSHTNAKYSVKKSSTKHRVHDSSIKKRSSQTPQQKYGLKPAVPQKPSSDKLATEPKTYRKQSVPAAQLPIMPLASAFESENPNLQSSTAESDSKNPPSINILATKPKTFRKQGASNAQLPIMPLASAFESENLNLQSSTAESDSKNPPSINILATKPKTFRKQGASTAQLPAMTLAAAFESENLNLQSSTAESDSPMFGVKVIPSVKQTRQNVVRGTDRSKINLIPPNPPPKPKTKSKFWNKI